MARTFSGKFPEGFLLSLTSQHLYPNICLPLRKERPAVNQPCYMRISYLLFEPISPKRIMINPKMIEEGAIKGTLHEE
jgi:hypothetical protein